MAVSNYIQSVLDAAKGRPRSTDWFKDKIAEFGKPGALDLIRDGKRSRTPFYGRLNMFFYDPKLKAKLPYYDRFPLVLPLERYSDGFLGINFHYLPIPLRMRLLETLDKRGFRGDYSKLKNIREVKPTIKHYLRRQFVSGFLELEEDDYAPSIFMPVAQFKKASASQVWRDSRRKI